MSKWITEHLEHPDLRHVLEVFIDVDAELRTCLTGYVLDDEGEQVATIDTWCGVAKTLVMQNTEKHEGREYTPVMQSTCVTATPSTDPRNRENITTRITYRWRPVDEQD